MEKAKSHIIRSWKKFSSSWSISKVERIGNVITEIGDDQCYCSDSTTELLVDHIWTEIFQRILKAKSFAIIFYSTPDILHTDQMSLGIQYEDTEVRVEESFIDFIQSYGKTAKEITEKKIYDMLQIDGQKLSQSADKLIWLYVGCFYDMLTFAELSYTKVNLTIMSTIIITLKIYLQNHFK